MNSIWHTAELISGDLKLKVLPGVGGRLWDVVYNGCSLLFQNPDLLGQNPDLGNLSKLPTRSPQYRFPLWGGEKTWIAPDSAWVDQAPFAQLDSGGYEVISQDGRQVRMISAICPQSRLQIERQITIETANSWSINHSIINRGDAGRYAGIWSVAMINHPACIGLDTMSSEIATVFGEPCNHVRVKRSNIICSCTNKSEFKFGVNNSNGRVFVRTEYDSDDIWIACSTPSPSEGEQFAHDHNFEVFNSGDYSYCEAEWHSPARSLASGEYLNFSQRFTVWGNSNPPKHINLSKQDEELLTCMSW